MQQRKFIKLVTLVLLVLVLIGLFAYVDNSLLAWGVLYIIILMLARPIMFLVFFGVDWHWAWTTNCEEFGLLAINTSQNVKNSTAKRPLLK